MVEIKTAAGGGDVDVKEIITLVLFLIAIIAFVAIVLKYVASGIFDSIVDAVKSFGFKNPLKDTRYDMNKDQLKEAVKTHAGRLAAGATTPIIENQTTYERSILPNLGLSSGLTNIITDMETGQTFVRSQRTLNYDAAAPDPRTSRDSFNAAISAEPVTYGTVLPEGVTSRNIFKQGFYFK